MRTPHTRTYGKLALHDGFWRLSEIEPHVALKLKAIFPRIPKASLGPYAFPAQPDAAMDLEWFMGRYPLAADPAALEALSAGVAAYRGQQAEVGRIMAPDFAPGALAGLKPGQAMRHHQGRAVALLQRFEGLLVADDMGEGKTYTGGACCLIPGALPATVVCPPHLAIQWARKLRELTTLEVHGAGRHALHLAAGRCADLRLHPAGRLDRRAGAPGHRPADPGRRPRAAARHRDERPAGRQGPGGHAAGPPLTVPPDADRNAGVQLRRGDVEPDELPPPRGAGRARGLLSRMVPRPRGARPRGAGDLSARTARDDP